MSRLAHAEISRLVHSGGSLASLSQLFAMSGQAYKFRVLKTGFGFFFFLCFNTFKSYFPPEGNGNIFSLKKIIEM